jgi:hypothetical protein
MKLIPIFIFLAGTGFGGIGAYAYASANAASAASATAAPSAEAVASVISQNPGLCPIDTLIQPTDEEATQAFRKRRDPLMWSAKDGEKDIVKLGRCYKGTITSVQCGADVDFKGIGKTSQKTIGFDKTPSGWMAVLF